MSLEQNFLKFNIANFKNEFNTILKKYVSTADDLEHVGSYEEIDKTEKKELELKGDEYMNQLVSFSLNALKLEDNKQEVLNTINSIFMDMGIDRDVYFQNIILELLKTQK